MTLREFTKDCNIKCKTVIAEIDWRPTMDLKYIQQGWDYFFKKAPRILCQKWNGFHKNEIVAVEWREVEEDSNGFADYS